MKNNEKEQAFDFSKILKKSIIIIPIGLLINLILVLYNNDLNILDVLVNFLPDYFVLVILLITIPWFANTGRLLIWTRFFNKKLTFMETFRITFFSELGAALSPTSIGSGPVKIALLVQKKMAPGTGLSIATLSSLEDFMFFIIAIPAAVTLSSAWDLPLFRVLFERLRYKILDVIAVVGIIILILFILSRIIKNRRLTRWNQQNQPSGSIITRLIQRAKIIMNEFRAAYNVIGRKGKLRFLITTMLTGIQWMCRYSVISALTAGFGINVKPILFFVLQWLVFCMGIFIPTPGAAGGAEASVYLIFFSFVPHESLGLITAGWRFLAFYFFLGIGAVIVLLFNLFSRLPYNRHKASELIFTEPVQ